MPTNKLKKGLALIGGLSAVTVLGACNSVEARPADSFYYANILKLDGIVNNTMSEIYDTVVTSGDTNSERVLNNILYLYSTTIFGEFYGDGNLKDAVVNNNEEAIQALADTYSVYEGNADKVVAKYQEIVYRIEEEFLTYVENESYQTRNVFDEEDFYDARVADYYELSDVEEDAFNRKLVEGSLRIEEGTNGYNDSLVGTDAYFGDILDRYENYIVDAVLPDIYRSELVAEYLMSQNYRSLGLSYSRKIDVISLANNSEAQYINATQNLMLAYSDLVINNVDTDNEYDPLVYDFEFLSELYKGTYEFGHDSYADNLAASIYTAAGWFRETGIDPLTGEEIYYYPQSQLGAIYKDYALLTDSRYTDDDSVRSDFTGDGAYSVDIGFQIKLNTLTSTSYTTHGWYTSTSLPDSTMPSAMQTRLFRMNVANEVDFNLNEDGSYIENAEYTYGWYRGGSYFLVPANYEESDESPYLVYDNSNWYIVRVDEAVKTAKLSEDNADSYSKMPKHEGDPLFLDSVAQEVAYGLSSNSTYENSAKQYYVEQMAISFHDDDVYDYFKTTFSTLFN